MVVWMAGWTPERLEANWVDMADPFKDKRNKEERDPSFSIISNVSASTDGMTVVNLATMLDSVLWVEMIYVPLLHPTEILGAFISVISIWIVTGALVYLAIERIVRNDYEIEGNVMLVTSGCAVIVNIM